MGRTYAVKGRFLARRGYWQTFTKRLEATDEHRAKELALSSIGGSHHVGRHLVTIETVEELAA
ncbi:MAG: 50S ribosomal protein L18a [Thermoplasmata archaeon]|nr:50S ribosomal protein L18a [Thermoplasmata archaeon]